MSNKQWYVFYTRSRQEKKVKELLERAGREVFLPMQRVLRQWSDRKKRVDIPLFNSYIFVKSNEADIQEIVQVPGIAWNIRHNGRPAVLREEEYAVINRFIATGYFLETTGDVEVFNIGDRAKVIDGPLTGLAGILTGRDKNQRFSILLEGINQVIQVQIPGNLLEKID